MNSLKPLCHVFSIILIMLSVLLVTVCATAPGKPLNSKVTDVQARQFTMQWTNPLDNGGKQITGYQIWLKKKTDANYVLYSNNFIGTEFTASIEINRDQNYLTYAVALNADGAGVPGDVIDLTTLSSAVPGKSVTPVILLFGSHSARLTWTKPTDDGGSNVLQYNIYLRDTTTFVTSLVAQVGATVLTTDISSLQRTTSYVLSVSSSNILGFGERSNESAPFITLPDVPGQMQRPVRLSIDIRSVTLQWKPPVDSTGSVNDGGGTITHYVIQKQQSAVLIDSGNWVNVVSLNVLADLKNGDFVYLVTGLLRGTSYFFRLFAINAAGSSIAGVPSIQTITVALGIPDTPGIPIVTQATSTQLTIKWMGPSDNGGFPVILYNVLYKKLADSDTMWISSGVSITGTSSTPQIYTVTGLYRATAYVFKMQAVNILADASKGISLASAVSMPSFTMPTIPQPPSKPSVIAILGASVSISWSAPSDNGGLPVTNFKVFTIQPNMFDAPTFETSGTQTTTTIYGLLRSTQYIFQVSARNSIGYGVGGATSDIVTTLPYVIASAPGTPYIQSSSDIDSRFIFLSWSAPTDTGNKPILNYRLFSRESTANYTTTYISTGNSNTYFKVSNLKRITSYYFQISAENDVGVGPQSGESMKVSTISDLANPPIDIKIESVSIWSVSLSWSPPIDSGGTPVVGYKIQVSLATQSVFQDTNVIVDWTQKSGIVTKLQKGTSYIFQLISQNARGWGLSSTSTAVATTLSVGVPDAPSRPQINGLLSRTVNLEWSTPDSGGNEISNYRIYVNRGADTDWRNIPGINVLVLNSYILTGLNLVTIYSFRISAVNIAGEGMMSDISSLITTLSEISDPPRNTNIDPVNGIKVFSIVVKWSIPINNGLSPVTAYVVQARIGQSNSVNPWTQVSPNLFPDTFEFEVMGLQRGTYYMFRVSAINSMGISAWSNLSQDGLGTLSIGVPGTPGKPIVTSFTDSTVTMQWSLPLDDGGSSISGYIISYAVGVNEDWVDTVIFSTATTNIVTNLRRATNYVFKITAINQYGIGYWSDISDKIITLGTAPSQPINLIISNVQAHSLTISWSEPILSGGFAIDSYKVIKRMEPDGFFVETGVIVSGNTFSSNVPNLKRGSQYAFRIIAHNVIGDSLASESSSITTKAIGAPNWVIGLSSSNIQPTSVTISWKIPLDDGGRPVIGYRIFYWKTFDKSKQFIDVGRMTSFDLVNLSRSMSLACSIAARNDISMGIPGPEFNIKLSSVLPSSPIAPFASQITSNSAALSWYPPDDDGGSVIFSYRVEAQIGMDTTFTSLMETGEDTSAVIQLNRATQYSLRLVAKTSAGWGSPSSAVTFSTTNLDVPDSPTNLAASQIQSTSLTLSWNAPLNNGGADIIGYRYYMRILNAINLDSGRDTFSILTAFVVKSLLRATTYSFAISAVNSQGQSKLTKELQIITLADLPGPPGVSTASIIGPHTLTLSWAPSVDNGGGLVTSYAVFYKLQSDQTFSTYPTVFPANVACPTCTLSASISGLMSNNVYLFATAATNSRGNSIMSDKVIVTMSTNGIPNTPGPPTLSNISKSSVTVSFTSVSLNGGSSITGYNVFIKNADAKQEFGQNSVFVPATGTSVILNYLIFATNYDVAISAETLLGTSPKSVSTSFRTIADIPASPRAPIVSMVSSTTATVRWSAVDYDGGDSVVSWKISIALTGSLSISQNGQSSNSGYYNGGYTNGGSTGGGSTSGYTFNSVLVTGNVYTHVFENLNPNSSYLFKIQAGNSIGFSAESPLSVVTYTLLVSLPGKPNRPVLVGNTALSITLAFASPINTGGGSLAFYKLRLREANGMYGDDDRMIPCSQATYTFFNLRKVTSYVFAVAVSNAAGYGIQSDDSNTITTLAIAPLNPEQIQITSISSNSFVVSWQPPLDDGGSAINGYVVNITSFNNYSYKKILSVGNVLSATVTGLNYNTNYTVQVTAKNEISIGNASPPTSPKTTRPVVPFAPLAPSTANVLLRTMTISWTASNNGGAAITLYKLQNAVGSTSSPQWIDVLTTTSFISVVQNLERNTFYTWRVAAQNSEGWGPFSPASFTVTTAALGAPSKPLNLRATSVTSSTITLMWDPPTDDGGVKDPATPTLFGVKDYRLYQVLGTAAFPTGRTVVGTTTVVSGLIRMTSYKFAVDCRNLQNTKYGYSDQSDPIIVATLPVVPTVPLALIVTDITVRSMRIYWLPPVDNGGLPIQQYQITATGQGLLSTSQRVKTINAMSMPSFTFTGLARALQYNFVVKAINSIGASPDTTPTSAFTLTTGVPDVPGIPAAATISYLQISVVWSPPADTGNSVITKYVIQFRVSGGVWDSGFEIIDTSNLLYLKTGLQYGTGYSFRVAANNQFGFGLYSAESNAFITLSVPPFFINAPTFSSITAVSAQISWNMPVNGGSPITSYVVHIKGLGRDYGSGINVSNSTTTTLIGGLTRANLYTVVVVAINANGAGANGEEGTFKTLPTGFPGQPGTPIASNVGVRELLLSWEPITDNRGLPVISYQILIKSSSGIQVYGEFPQTAYLGINIVDLIRGKHYNFQVIGSNSNGYGDPSLYSDVVTTKQVGPPTPPFQPIASEITRRSVLLTWQPPVDDGGHTILTYIIYKKFVHTDPALNVFDSGTKIPSALSYVMNGLQRSTSYTFKIVAQNFEGLSKESLETTVTLLSDRPTRPEEITVIPNETQVFLTWRQPIDNGGTPITNYVVNIYQNGIKVSQQLTDNILTNSMSIVNLARETTYRFGMVAKNSRGYGPESLLSAEVKTLSAEVLFISERNSGTILKVNVETGEISNVFLPGLGDLKKPWGFDIGPDGNIYVVNGSKNTILMYDPTSGKYLGVWATLQSEARGIRWRDTILYVCGYHKNQILRYRYLAGRGTGSLLSPFTVDPRKTSGPTLNHPFELRFVTINGAESLFVASEHSNNILSFNGETGAFERIVTTQKVNLLNSFDLDQSREALYVTGSYAGKVIVKFNSSGTFIDKFFDKDLNRPMSMIVSRTNLYLYVTAGNEIRSYDSVTGEFMGVIASKTNGNLGTLLSYQSPPSI